MTRESGVLGRPLLRVEDRPLLTGRAEFVDDIRLPELAEAAFLRSPVAHGRIVRLDVARARTLDGVEAFIAADLGLPPLQPPLETPGAWCPPRPVLAEGVVRFVGEPVAVVVAPSRYAAEDALELIELELEPLPAVAAAGAATAPGAPLLHPPSGNVFFESRLEAGDVDAAFAAAAVVVERSFRNPRLCAAPLEGRALAAALEGEGLVLYASTQAPHKLGAIVAELLDLPRAHVRVVCPDVGGGFGQKAHAYPEEIAVAWLARRLGRPVKWVEDRAENLLAASHARDAEVRVRAAADADGRLLALDADVVCDQGAYGVYPHGNILEALGTPAMIPGPYRLSAYRARARAVATNKCPEGAYRGVGLPVSAFVHERLLDVLARELGLDRAEIRRRNLIRSDELPLTTLTNQRYDSGDYVLALETALAAVGWEEFEAERLAARREGRLLGIGVSCYVEYTGINSRVFQGRGMVGIAGFDGAHVLLDADGRATVWTTLPSAGQGLVTTFSQLVADELGLPLEAVSVPRVDTRVGGIDGTGTFASRSAIAGGGALRAAAGELRRRLLEDAADRLEIAAADLELAGGFVRAAGTPGIGVAIGVLVAEAPERFRVSEQFDPPAVCYPYATHACRVEVDAGTGGVALLRYVVVEDCGRLINPLVVEGQTHGATAQGIGGTLLESVVYDGDGQLLTGSFMDYLLPTAADVPALEVSHLEIPAPDSPYGAKGVGEGGTLAPPGAIANAVSHALGVELNELPLTPERVRAAAEAALA